MPLHPALNRFLLPAQEYITCVLWNALYHITGTDVVRALVFHPEVRTVSSYQKLK
jgi:transcription factor STE12